MSRVMNPIAIPAGAEVSIKGQRITIKGAKGTVEHEVHSDVEIKQADGTIQFAPRGNDRKSVALTGTTRALMNNMIQGVTVGFERKLELVGVGYRAQAQGSNLNLTLGFSHPVSYPVPAGITVETPSQTEVVVKGIDKQQVGQVASEIRAFRPPEPYKGKGVRYSDERVVRKEAKKK